MLKRFLPSERLAKLDQPEDPIAEKVWRVRDLARKLLVDQANRLKLTTVGIEHVRAAVEIAHRLEAVMEHYEEQLRAAPAEAPVR